jgi:paraquat-inducible protein B
MSKKVNPTSIGVFIFIGIVLFVAGLLLFTSATFFTHKVLFIIYFDNTLTGLNEGAPVKFRGVTIGTVSRVMIHYNQATNDQAMPVIIEVREDLIRKRLEGPTIFKSLNDLSEEIRKGLRAKLETESFVTGVLYVELEREPSAPPAVFHQLTPEYVEIPSRSTEIQQLMKNLAKVNLADLQQRLDTLISRADTVLSEVKMDAISTDLTNLLVSANRVVTDPDLTNSFASLKAALDQFRVLGAHVNDRVDPLANGVTNTLDKLNAALAQARGGLQNFRDMLAADSTLRNQVSVALDQFAEASQSVSVLADYLRNHPNSLLMGRKPSSDKLP